MSNPFLAEIRIFAGNFAPKGWATCDGQLIPISQNTALFSLLGTTYGGDGKSNFALPDLRDRVPMQAGQGPGLSLRDLGESGGETTVTLLQTEMAVHSHDPLEAFVGRGVNAHTPGPQLTIGISQGNFAYDDPNAPQPPPMTTMHPASTSVVGGDLPHNNVMPSLGLTFIIALQGVFPARS
jgi:microcystin-dependent protein